MTRRALLIGLNYIGSSAQLNGCINDVINIKNFLKQEHHFEDTEIRVMTEASDNTKNIPNRANILEGLRWLVEGNGPNSKLFLHYSGHGTYMRDTSGDEKDGRDEALCPLDYSKVGMIKDDEIRKILVEPLKEGAQLFFLCDSCHSGSMADLKHVYQVKTTGTSTSYTVTSDSHYKSTQGVVVFVSGSLDSQTSADAYLPDLDNPLRKEFQGALTYSFLKTYETLKKDGKPLTYKRLMKNLLIFIKQKGFTQVPQISSGKFMDLGQEIKIA